MSTLTETQEALPVGHLARGSRPLACRLRDRLRVRDVPRLVLAVRGQRLGRRRGRRRRARGRGQRRQRPRPRREPDRASAVAGLLRRRAHAATPVRVERDPPLRRPTSRSAGTLTSKGTSVPVELDGHDRRAVPAPGRGRARRPCCSRPRSTARAFGIDWHMELPSGEPALANDVKLSGELVPGEGVSDEGPRHLRQPAPRLPQYGPAPRGRRAPTRRGGARALGRAEGRAAVRRGRRRRAGAGGGHGASRRDRRRRRDPVRDAGVQPLDPRPAQERARLGLAPAGDEPAPEQAGRGRRRERRRVRRRLGAGRAAQGPGGHRRPRRRRRGRGRPRAPAVRRGRPARGRRICASSSPRSSTRSSS